MKTILKIIALFTGATIAIYIAISIVSLSLDITAWSKDERIILVVCPFSLSAVILIIYKIWTTEDVTRTSFIEHELFDRDIFKERHGEGSDISL